MSKNKTLFRSRTSKVASWKREQEDDGEMDEDFEVVTPRLSHTIQDPQFIMRDETNAENITILKLRRWWI